MANDYNKSGLEDSIRAIFEAMFGELEESAETRRTSSMPVELRETA